VKTPPCLLWLALLLPANGTAEVLPIIDAHSQFDDDTPVRQVIRYAARAGVTQVLLSARGGMTPEDVLELADKYPGCIVPSVRTKGRAYAANDPKFYTLLDEQFKARGFRAMSELIVAHARKGKGAPEVNLSLDAPQILEAIGRAMAKGWPVVLHYEFRWFGHAYGSSARAARMAELRSLLARHPGQSFALIHMAQLGAGEAAELLAAHPNLVFLTSHANPITTGASRQPWTNLYAGDELAPQWRSLLLRYPERFVLAFDNVWPEHWSDKYAQQVKLWRHALGKLPPEVAHAVAHRNAERLWKLSPASAGEGCAALAQ
jgi:predicted TIM-barrel fold metal-dependent hydrolase